MGGPGTPGMLGGGMTCPVPALTRELLGAMWHIPTPGILFAVGFAELLLGTRQQCLLPRSSKSIHSRHPVVPVEMSCEWVGGC